uniref:Neur_chan_LBD domain-containing protein n=1 Tax=Heterorhabditis bacteriophora TaxID=37862 RepID=A0A1I7W7U9_HETBA
MLIILFLSCCIPLLDAQNDMDTIEIKNYHNRIIK